MLLLANVLCEVVLVFTCMFYHADYYRIIVIAYDYECSQHHASFHVCIYKGSESGNLPPPPPHTHTLTNEPMREFNEEDPMNHNERENEENEKTRDISKKKKKKKKVKS